MKHLHKTTKTFIRSFSTMDREIGYSMLADILQLALILLIVVPITGLLLYKSMMSLAGVMPTLTYVNNFVQDEGALPPLTPQMEEQLDSNVSVIKMFLVKSGLVLFGMIVLVLLISSAFRCFVYGRLHKVGFRQYFKIFMIHNIIWYLFWGVLITASLFLFKPSTAGIIIAIKILLMIMLTPLYRAIHKPKVKNIPKEFLEKVVMRFYIYLIPFALILLVVVVSMYVLSMLAGMLPLKLMGFIIFIYGSLLIAWSRHYLFMTIEEK